MMQLEFDFKIRKKRHFTFRNKLWYVKREDGRLLGHGRTIKEANSIATITEDIYDRTAEERMKPILSMPFTPITDVWQEPWIAPYFEPVSKSICLWDNMPIRDRTKPMGLSCPCEKCSIWS